MALLDSEVARIKAELGYNLLTVAAEPYIGFVSVFNQVIQPYIQGGASTTSSTSVTASTSPAPVTLTLASATGFSSGARIVVDVDSRQEVATVQSVSGSTVTALLSLAHSGTYPVTVEGGETIVRNILRQIARITDSGGTLQSASAQSGIKKVDEVEFFGGPDGSGSRFASVIEALDFWRDQLATTLGVHRINGGRGGGGSSVAIY